MTGRSKEETADITLLGNQKTQYPSDYAPEMLETFENKHQGNDYFVKFNCPEFTSLCPITGQPDFATVTISYVPNIKMVESKSLKLYLFSFRNHGDFHEDCMNIIMKDLIKLMDPKYIEVWGKFTPRGGISIDPYCNYGKPGTKWEEIAFNRMANHDMYPEKVDNRWKITPINPDLSAFYSYSNKCLNRSLISSGKSLKSSSVHFTSSYPIKDFISSYLSDNPGKVTILTGIKQSSVIIASGLSGKLYSSFTANKLSSKLQVKLDELSISSCDGNIEAYFILSPIDKLISVPC